METKEIKINNFKPYLVDSNCLFNNLFDILNKKLFNLSY